MDKKTATQGRLITVKHAVPAYYSEYAGRPKMIFKPGMVAMVHAVAPKVRRVVRGPQHDRKLEFIVADYTAPETGKTERVSVHFCNAVAVRKAS